MDIHSQMTHFQYLICPHTKNTERVGGLKCEHPMDYIHIYHIWFRRKMFVDQFYVQDSPHHISFPVVRDLRIISSFDISFGYCFRNPVGMFIILHQFRGTPHIPHHPGEVVILGTQYAGEMKIPGTATGRIMQCG